MVDKRSSYWLIFNFAGKLVGAAFVIVGSILAVWAIATAIGSPEKLRATDAILVVGLALLAVFLGFLLIRAKPFYPKTDKEE